MVFRIIQGHRGFIDFSSTPGKGTTFEICIPVAVSNPVTVPDVAEAKVPEGLVRCDPTRVLVVDDEKTILRLFQMILSSALTGRVIDTAVNGEEGVKTFVAGHHGVIVMDLHMPVMDGQAAFSKIFNYCKTHNWEMPSVVFCTGFAPPDSIRDVLGDGSKHCLLSKPVSGESLVNVVTGRLPK